MDLKIKPAASCKYDLIALGDCMIRLSPPGHGRVEFAPSLEVWVGGIFGECDGEDAQPGRNCSLFRVHLAGEVFGRHLAPYLPGPPPPR